LSGRGGAACGIPVKYGDPKIAFQRVAYNMVGITLGLLVVLYPFPMLMRRIHGRAQPDRNNAVVQ